MPYYLLERGGGELLAMNVALPDEEARRHGEGSVAVRAVCVWTGAAGVAEFREFLEATRREGHAPCRGWVHAPRTSEVYEVALDAARLRDRLGGHPAAGYVAVDPGPERRVRTVGEFLADIPG